MLPPEAWPGILQEHLAMITTGGVHNEKYTMDLYMTIASELCFPSTRPGTRDMYYFGFALDLLLALAMAR